MRHLNKKLAAAATVAAVIGAMGVCVAQTTDDQADRDTPQEVANPQQVHVNSNASGQDIYFFRDQGNAPETDPAAHLMLIKHDQMVPVAQTTTTTTTVAQSTTPTDATSTTATMPAASDTGNTESGTDTSAAAPVDNSPPLAPKADRN